MRTVSLPGGEVVPAMGLGTWRMGEKRNERADEVKALKLGLELGFRLIDTAEMYGEGGAEEVVAEAVGGDRDRLVIVSKVYPHNASRKGAISACERSLKRLKTDRIDLYLLHWRGSIPLAETLEAFERLKKDGKIRHWGVSNFDTDDMAELQALAAGKGCAVDQVLYHLAQRGIEWALLPKCRASNVPVMAYSPLGQGTVLTSKALAGIAQKLAVPPAAVAVAWTLREAGVIAIPKASRLEHVRELAEGFDLLLAREDLAALDAAFPPPAGASRLSML